MLIVDARWCKKIVSRQISSYAASPKCNIVGIEFHLNSQSYSTGVRRSKITEKFFFKKCFNFRVFEDESINKAQVFSPTIQ